MISMHPDDFVRGGLLSDADVVVEAARWTAWDYNGSLPIADVLALQVTFREVDTDSVHEQYFANGKVTDRISPNLQDSGDTLNGEGHIVKGSNAAEFLTSLVECANDAKVDMTLLREGKASSLVGIKMHVIRKAAPKREGLAQREKKEGREDTILVCNKLISVPWGPGGKGKGMGAGKAAAKPAAAAAKPTAAAPGTKAGGPTTQQTFDFIMGDPDLLQTLVTAMSEALSEGEPLNMAMMRIKTMRALPSSLEVGVKNAMVAAAINTEFIGQLGGFTVSGEGKDWTIAA